ncbi:hypothetical protein CC78DRAFT_588135 [Lojkania enalia]|uniref:Uncharacterized protein n=1 Tax=Lojkania enalia TaxID=147567 RepID=A0A9P4JWH8_9PLEO|nr:hypothetical protein CC78DRAFT_588135 [Didymosphaeria enalia]
MGSGLTFSPPPAGRTLLAFPMADSLLISALVFFLTGLLLSALVTYRDYRAIKHIDYVIKQWQWVLLGFGLIQISFFSFGIGSVVFTMFTEHHLDRIEPAILWTFQFTLWTNICSSAQVLCTSCFILSATERWVSRLALRSETSFELGRMRPRTTG